MPKAAPKVPASPSVSVEIRIDRRLRFANQCYDVEFEQDDDGTVTFRGSLKPRMVAAAKVRAPEKFGDDPRDGEDQILRVHSGRRDGDVTP